MFIAVNPFYDAYFHSDLLGKIIFLMLIAFSIISWVILIHKILLTNSVMQQSQQFYRAFQKHKFNPLGLEHERYASKKDWNPFLDLYGVLKKYTVEVLNKNRRFGQKYHYDDDDQPSYLSPSDIDFVESHLMTAVASQSINLQRNLYILSTIVSLAPLVGLLGTVWGILTSFSQMQTQAMGSSNQMVLGGISLALATTVIGLLDAIPALIGYNYLKSHIRDFETEMGSFSNEILATVEMQYRKVDVH